VSAFEFVLTLYAIVIALGVARVLTGYVALIEFRRGVVDAPLFFIWLSFLLLVHRGGLVFLNSNPPFLGGLAAG